MGIQIHPTAIVSPHAELADGVVIGPFSIVDENVTVASIAKVRENKELETADTSELLTDEEEAASAALAAENAKKAAGQSDNSETDDELMDELLKRAEDDAKDDSDEE